MNPITTPSFLRNARTMFAFSVTQKLVVFLVNYLIMSGIGPEVLGKISIRLELLLSTSLFLSREGIRLTCLRLKSSHQDVVNLSMLVLPLIVMIHLVLISSFILVGFMEFEDFNVIVCYIIATWIESSVEPLFNIFQYEMIIRPKLTAEMIALLCKAIVTCLLLRRASFALIAFGIAQLCYSIIYSAVLAWYWVSLKESYPHLGALKLALPSSFFELLRLVDCRTLHSAVTFSGSSLIKHMLTEADKIALSLLCDLHDQGIYAFVGNYGSIIPRILFLPVEESVRLSLSRYVASSDLSYEKRNEIRAVFTSTTTIAMLVGSTIALFGPFFVRIFVKALLKPQWNVPEIIEGFCYYCYYLLVLGINGTSEACLHSIIPQSEVVVLNAGYGLSSCAFVFSTFVCDGSSTIIRANIVAMVVRTMWSIKKLNSLLNFNLVCKDSMKELLWWLMLWFGTYHVLSIWYDVNSADKLEMNNSTVLYVAGGAVLGIIYLLISYLLLPPFVKRYVHSKIISKF